MTKLLSLNLKIYIRIVIVFFVLLFLFFAASLNANTFAQSEFITDASIVYNVNENAVTTVNYKINLENTSTNIYATSYVLTLEGIKPLNVKAFEGSKYLPIFIEEKNDLVTLKVDFVDELVGIGKKREFSIFYDDNSISQKTGEIWEISIPKLSKDESFRLYDVVLSVPKSFGNLAYISPKPKENYESHERLVFTFNKELLSKNPISAGFGKFQVFSFDLTYHLENPLSTIGRIDIATPPDTAFQTVYYQSLTPKPEKIYPDENGNWLATFKLSPRERIDVKVQGFVQIFPSLQNRISTDSDVLELNKKSSEFWQVDDPEIKNLAQKLKTPKAIYDYVSTHLTYDYSRVRPNVNRLGAKYILNNPKNAICMEFTDLFIALSRSAGIPAREVNGFAYSENPDLQPLSLVADVLHAWPEYYDSKANTWIPVDPTWGSTTGGEDFFSKMDLRHFTFVIHGTDDTKPYPPGSYKLGPNPQKDVFVSFGQLPDTRISHPEIIIEYQKNLPFLTSPNVKVVNPGPVAIYESQINVFFDDQKIKSLKIDILPPYGIYEFPVSIPFEIFGWKIPHNVRVEAFDRQISIPTIRNQIIISDLIFVFLIVLITSILIIVKIKKFPFKKKKNENIFNNEKDHKSSS